MKEKLPEAKLSGISADFADLASFESFVKSLDGIDILINKVGIFTSQSFADTTDADRYRMFEVNVMNGVKLSRAL